MIASMILVGLLLVLVMLWVSIGISYIACLILDEFLIWLARYVNLRKVFMLCVFLVLIHFLYTGIAEWILMIIG